MVEVDEISIVEFVEKRAKEMKMMLELCQTVSGNDAPQQRLPRHMRRRAANHNVKRLPRSLRHKVPKDSLAVKKKCPSRKHRRRPRNLFEEYEKRSSKKRWLETHIWHAKRFKMVDLWGCKIAHNRNDRGVRAAYRDSRNECLIIDVSWMHCFEIIGSETDIITALKPFIFNFEDSCFVNEQFKMGQYEGEIVLYTKSNDQQIPIANVKFLWRLDISPQSKRSLLLWVHPSCANELMDHFKETLDLVTQESNDKVLANNAIEVHSRVKDFCRYKLIGPKSQSVLYAALKISNLKDHKAKAFHDFSDNEFSSIILQHNNWHELNSTNPIMFPSRAVHGLLVQDPRLNMPHKRTNSEPSGILSSHSQHRIDKFDQSISYSNIWNRDLMSKLHEIKLSTHSMNELRSGSLLTNYNPAIPILLFQNPGCSNNAGDTGHGSGWDIVIPCGWGMPFWLGFIYRGARSIGLEELRRIDYETAYPTFPEFYPDSKSGKEFCLSAYKQLSSKYERMPKSKRPNYKKLKVQTPFHCPWQELCEEWCVKSQHGEIESSGSKTFFVIRDNRFLRQFDNSLKLLHHPEDETDPTPSGRVTRKVTVRGSSRCYLSVERNGLKKIILDGSSLRPSAYVEQMTSTYSMGLVTVVVENLERGNPKRCMICIPSSEDVVSYYGGERSIFEPPGDASHAGRHDTENMPGTENVVDFCSRRVIGFSVAGGFAFFKGKGRAIGFVSLLGLKALHSSNAEHAKAAAATLTPRNARLDLVLVRSTTSLHYKFATIKTIFDVPQ